MSIPNDHYSSLVGLPRLEGANGNRHSSRRRTAGLSLIELIVFMVIVSVAVAGVLGALGIATRSSADPVIHKQALAIAEAVLEEVQLQPFTYCDPDDSQAATALSATVGAGDCNATVEVIGAEGETRYSTTTPFDNVNDYHGFDSNVAQSGLTGIRNIDSTLIAGLEGYRVTVSVAGQPLGPVGLIIGDDANARPQSLLTTVTVTGIGNTTVTLHGYRARYAPNALP
jgi:MSHA pilin protein MshD